MSTVQLIVNADDFGISPGVNRGIVAAHRDGIVTSASIMVNGPAFEHAVALARDNPKLDLGVHLTLTELSPVANAQSVASLTDAAGRFAPNAIEFARRYSLGLVRPAEVRRELDAQIAHAFSRGLAISHLDAHQHVHALPGIARIVRELAHGYGIGAVRYPREGLRRYMFRVPVSARRLGEQIALNAVCMLSPLRKLPHPRRFVGFHFGGRLDERNLATLLQALPGRGSIELMCHPADEESDGPQRAWGYAGPAERAALTSARIRAMIAALGIELAGFRDLR